MLNTIRQVHEGTSSLGSKILLVLLAAALTFIGTVLSGAGQFQAQQARQETEINSLIEDDQSIHSELRTVISNEGILTTNVAVLTQRMADRLGGDPPVRLK